MLRELINRPILKRPRTCESCGSDFECQIGLKGCWCSGVNLTNEGRQKLAESYKDCLCPMCLQELSVNDMPTKAPEGEMPEI